MLKVLFLCLVRATLWKIPKYYLELSHFEITCLCRGPPLWRSYFCQFTSPPYSFVSTQIHLNQKLILPTSKSSYTQCILCSFTPTVKTTNKLYILQSNFSKAVATDGQMDLGLLTTKTALLMSEVQPFTKTNIRTDHSFLMFTLLAPETIQTSR